MNSTITNTVDSFNGTWAISDHNLVPNGVVNYIMECFPKVERFRKIPLDDVNRVLNEVWEGPGSLDKVQTLASEMRLRRMTMVDDKSNDPVKTIDDYDSDAFVYTVDTSNESED